MKSIIAAAVLAALGTSVANAQDSFPDGPVTIIVPYGTGGSTDTTMRALAIELEKIWNQPIVIVNRPGAGSMIGTTELTQAEPDGKTLLINTAAITTAPALQSDLQFDPVNDITPISLLITSPYVLVGGANVQSTDFSGFMEEAQSRLMFMATAGPGSSGHFMSELVMQAADLPADIVHFGGAGESFTNLMGGHADTYISTTQSVMPYVNDGRAKALAVLAPERFPLLPDIQSSGEVGVAGVELEGWVAIFGPGGMDDALVDRINADLAEAMASERMQEQLEQNYALAGNLSPAEFGEIYVRDLQIWRDLAAERGIGQ
ncbi:Bug family tripartite tricarboxylate transporter substrate binding protein [Roseinatronobacter alkalisoli]|uniref:Tripartite tricarboxylate transporter substrate binding protein n=1 Tax=Roseinatronobacter alkalisoli TaxID=3028235 RepID=A0ABT5TDC8_9RHOB|nr:tripartite tricarboxylate transporter substrate binding protein [Roseinatronobacter sp. HJB301]MDD7973121.1 tripartite tricarboxylate transporter substrate binding protein [Roseinatronobacter sp. HJB301]